MENEIMIFDNKEKSEIKNMSDELVILIGDLKEVISKIKDIAIIVDSNHYISHYEVINKPDYYLEAFHLLSDVVEKLQNEPTEEAVSRLQKPIETIKKSFFELEDLIYTIIKEGIEYTESINELIISKRDYSRLIIDKQLNEKYKNLIEHINISLEWYIDNEKTKKIVTLQKTIIENPIPKQPLNFVELFIPEFQKKISVMFERLQLNGFIDKNNYWIINTNINEPAKLFYYLKDNKVMKSHKFAPAIKCFYNEFGCEVVEKANGNPRACTRTNLLIQCDNETEKIYNSFLLTLINQK
jgi:hypothetical protein